LIDKILNFLQKNSTIIFLPLDKQKKYNVFKV